MSVHRFTQDVRRRFADHRFKEKGATYEHLA